MEEFIYPTTKQEYEKLTQEELDEIVRLHGKWLNNDPDGKKAVITSKDLSGLCLADADLSYAVIVDVKLNNADMNHVNLYKADIKYTEMRHANLKSAIISNAWIYSVDGSDSDFTYADLERSKLSACTFKRSSFESANLDKTYITNLNMCNANLKYSDLRYTYLCDVNVTGADFYGADVSNLIIATDLSGAENLPYIPMACPDTGSFIGWKKCVVFEEVLYKEIYDGKIITKPWDYRTKPVIVKLLIPEDAKRSSAGGRKCRCDKAVVLAIQDLDGHDLECVTARSIYISSFEYTVGETVKAEFNLNRWQECAQGIHFFINRQEAVNY